MTDEPDVLIVGGSLVGPSTALFLRLNNVESLAGREIASYFPNLNAGVEEFSPTVRLFIDQDALV